MTDYISDAYYQFTSKVDKHTKQRQVILLRPIYAKLHGIKMTVPVGTVSNGFTIPWPFSNIIAPYGHGVQAAFWHDWAWNCRLAPRKDLDKMFLRAMKLAGVGWFKRRVFYRGVRIGDKLGY